MGTDDGRMAKLLSDHPNRDSVKFRGVTDSVPAMPKFSDNSALFGTRELLLVDLRLACAGTKDRLVNREFGAGFEFGEPGVETDGDGSSFLNFDQEAVLEIEDKVMLASVAGKDQEVAQFGGSIGGLFFDNDHGGRVSGPRATTSDPGAGFAVTVAFFRLSGVQDANDRDIVLLAEFLEASEPFTDYALVIDLAFGCLGGDAFDDVEAGFGMSSLQGF